MTTKVSETITQVRAFLCETSPRFWSDAELQDHYRRGVNDLWGAILDLHGDHYLKVVEDGSVLLRSGLTSISGVPEDCFRIQLIEPLDISESGSARSVMFVPKKYKSDEFAGARTMGTVDVTNASGRIIYYHLSGVGPPIDKPTVLIAPKISSTLPLRLAYNPTLKFDPNGPNPVPGESDNALYAWTIAYARAKEREDRSPDANWIQIYATEKQLMLTRLTPRQEQEPEVVDDLFQGFGGNW